MAELTQDEALAQYKRNERANSPAFPHPDGHYNGLTKREYFAAMAMQGILANESVRPAQHPSGVRLDDLDLSVRASNVLALGGIRTIAELMQKTDLDMFCIRGCGRTTIREIKKALKQHGLEFGSDYSSTPGNQEADVSDRAVRMADVILAALAKTQ